MKNLSIFLIFLQLFFVSCIKDSNEMNDYEVFYLSTETELNDENFLEIANGITPFLKQYLKIKYKNKDGINSYKNIRASYGTNLTIESEINLIHGNLKIDRSSSILFFKTLIKYKKVFASKDFISRLNAYVTISSEGTLENRWFLGTLAAALGAGPCVTGPLSILDSCIGITTGILTAPTGIGAVANWGAAAASYGYGMSALGDC